MNFTPDFGWYYIDANNRAPAWSSVEFFYDFITGNPIFISENGGVGPFGIEVSAENVVEGDVVQLADADGDFYHTLIISDFREDDVLVCAHTDDVLDRPLSEYNYASLRVLHVEGAMLYFDDEKRFDELINAVALPPRCE